MNAMLLLTFGVFFSVFAVVQVWIFAKGREWQEHKKKDLLILQMLFIALVSLWIVMEVCGL